MRTIFCWPIFAIIHLRSLINIRIYLSFSDYYSSTYNNNNVQVKSRNRYRITIVDKLWLILSYRNIFCEAIKYSLVFVANEFYYYCISVDSNLLLSFQTNNCLVTQFIYCCFSKFLILKFYFCSVHIVLLTYKGLLLSKSKFFKWLKIYLVKIMH